MTRLNKKMLSSSSPPGEVTTAPWITSGAMTASTVVSNAPSRLGGVVVTATDDGGDIDVILWDSPTSDVTSDEYLARITVTTTTAKAQASFGDLAGPGVQATLGIYVQVVAGDCQVLVYYR